MMDGDGSSPVEDLVAAVRATADAYRNRASDRDRTAVCLVPGWLLDSEDPDETQRVADEVARACGFKGAEIRRA